MIKKKKFKIICKLTHDIKIKNGNTYNGNSLQNIIIYYYIKETLILII